jgi:EAL domain-containing protein (putative c-di-GMP-specific phosphodiesterase class I)
VAARVLRYAIARFTAGGMPAAASIGARGGLAGILAQAEARSLAMQAALSGHRFRLAYQPVVALADRVVHHYEALLRPIATPGLVVDGTQEFVTFAEAVGLSDLLDIAVLEEALAGLRESSAAAVAVNVSGLSLQNEAFRDRMFAALQAAAPAIAARDGGLRLMVELTETSEIEDMQAAAAALASLRAMGIAVCLDDFGMGAAAFRYLQQFHVDYVKIDGSFVHAAMAGGRERALVGSMVALATAAGARTVAEMIETEQQASLMAELGVTQGQGWLFGRPGALPGALPGARR